jgi:hypothetical protein
MVIRIDEINDQKSKVMVKDKAIISLPNRNACLLDLFPSVLRLYFEVTEAGDYIEAIDYAWNMLHTSSRQSLAGQSSELYKKYGHDT